MGKHEYKPYDELEYCCKCFGIEGSMPTDCPGEPMSNEVIDMVYRGNYDYRNDKGWVHELSPMGRDRIKSRLFSRYLALDGENPTDTELCLSIGCTKEQLEEVKTGVLRFLHERNRA